MEDSQENGPITVIQEEAENILDDFRKQSPMLIADDTEPEKPRNSNNSSILRDPMSATQNRFSSTSKQSVTALWKGVSSLTASVGNKSDAPDNMVQAQIQLKMKQHEQSQLQARLVKLQKEDELMNKRIKDSLRKQQFMKQMQAEKFSRHQTKQQLLQSQRDTEESNRNRFNHFRTQNKSQIESHKKQIFDSNKFVQKDIKQQQRKIQEVVQKNKFDNLEEKKQNFKQIYEVKQNAWKNRKDNTMRSYDNTKNLYMERVEKTKIEAQKVDELTKLLEQQEASYLEKLKMTQAKEKEVLAMQNMIQAQGIRVQPKG